tara:strand:- start:11058 stop:11405 length:348 start_codon:yes stop_codon:yes gene_type:complete
MAISTQFLSLAKIGQHPQDIGQSARSAISQLAVAVENACKYSAYMNSPISVLTVDSEDRQNNAKIFRDVVISLMPVLVDLEKLKALDAETVTKADFIADMEAGGLNLAEYAAQFK